MIRGQMNLKRTALVAVVVLVSLLIAGLVADFLSFDRTKGGYEPPYTDYTGEPIDWATVETTPTGMRKSGYILDGFVDCTTGMMHFGLLGI